MKKKKRFGVLRTEIVIHILFRDRDQFDIVVRTAER